MPEHNLGSHVIIRDVYGNDKEFRVEAIFDVDEQAFALLTSKDETHVMKVEGDDIIGLADPIDRNSILNAYEMVNSLPDSDQSELRTE